MDRRTSSSNDNYKNYIINPKNKKVNFRNRPLKKYNKIPDISVINNSYEFLNHQSIFSLQNCNIRNFESQSKYAINQDDSMFIRDYNVANSEKNNFASSNSLTNVANEK